jgi:hypothetical protein
MRIPRRCCRLRAQMDTAASQLSEAQALLEAERDSHAAAANELRTQLRRTEDKSEQLNFDLQQVRDQLQFEAAEKQRYWKERKEKQEEINKMMVGRWDRCRNMLCTHCTCCARCVSCAVCWLCWLAR